MALSFNPSSNKYTDQLMGLFGELALDEYKQQQKDKSLKEKRKIAEESYEKFKSGLIGEQPSMSIVGGGEQYEKITGRKIPDAFRYVPGREIPGDISPMIPSEQMTYDPESGTTRKSISQIVNPQYKLLQQQQEQQQEQQQQQQAARSKSAPLFLRPPAEVPTKREGGFLGIGAKKVPQYNEVTQGVMKNIKNEFDLRELLDNQEEYEAAGVDVQTILNFYLQEE